ncbi:hypothetical protein [Rhizobium sp. 1399]|jgi:hypothetical protein|uniref:hypothetical protein n=1 Tax=unclassified Rhizobium TaxID=2613769 RepID=UPI000DDCF8A6|nr:hypothetical protein [Rhizobium sp. 1399]MDR6665505.1 hypothetical protein [Rhizobium sp. 1399]
MHQRLQEKTESEPTSEELWSVFDFSRRYRLAKSEENRLLKLFGKMASPRDLLSSARRTELSP